MAIAATCPHCQTHLNVKDEMAGKKGRCPKCQGKFRVPLRQSATESRTGGATRQNPASAVPRRDVPHRGPTLAQIASTERRSARDLQAEILGGFRQHPPTNQHPATTSAWSSVAALLMVAMPLALVAMIGAIGVATVAHAVANVGMLSDPPALALLYVGGIAGGMFVFLLLLKPLVAPRIALQRGRALTPASDPLLFALVEAVGARIGVPPLRWITVDCETDVSVRSRRRWIPRTGDDLVLTIGLPLAAGFTVEQLTGEITHALAPYAQSHGGTARLAPLARSSSEWLRRLARERDAWDNRLLKRASRSSSPMRALLLFARLMAGLGRVLPMILFWLGRMLCGRLLRRIEFNADRRQAEVVGHETFERTLEQRVLVEFSFRGIQSDADILFREGRLADNLPKLTLATIEQLPEEVRQFVLGLIDRPSDGGFSIHPSDADRIAAVRRQPSPGFYHCSLPAAALFGNFNQLAREVTLGYYTQLFGGGFLPSQLLPVEAAVADEGQQHSRQTVRRFYFDSFSPLRPIRLPSVHFSATDNPQLVRAQLERNRQTMLDDAAAYRALAREYEQHWAELIEISQAVALWEIDLPPAGSSLSPHNGSLEEAEEEQERLEREWHDLSERMSPFESAAGWRLYSALALLQQPPLRDELPDAGQRSAQCERQLPVIASIAAQFESLQELRRDQAVLSLLMDRLALSNGSRDVDERIRAQVKRVARELRGLHELFSRIEMPLAGGGTTTVARHVLAAIPSPEDRRGVLQDTQTFCDRIELLYKQTLAALCEQAEEVERTLGMRQIASPASGVAAHS